MACTCVIEQIIEDGVQRGRLVSQCTECAAKTSTDVKKMRGTCLACGTIHEGGHICTPELQRLKEIDAECGPRAVREALIALGQKGFNNKVETLENEAKIIRERK